jgi:hypothetical protein
MSQKRPLKIKLSLPVAYTQTELDTKRDRLTATIFEYDKIEDEKSEVGKTYTDQLKSLRAEMRQLSRAINAKVEDREVECVVNYHAPSVGWKTTMRSDTNEVIKTEPMTNDEKQLNLFEEVDQLEGMYGAPDPRTAPPPPPDDNNASDANSAGA